MLKNTPACQIWPIFDTKRWITLERKKISKIANILANFWKVEVGTLGIGCDCTQWSRSDHCEGEALAFLKGSGGMLPRKNLKIETVKYAFFNVLVNDSTHLLQEKIGLKMYTVSCAQRKITGERTTWMPYVMLIFCLDNCLPRTGTWKKAKRHRRNLNSDWRTRRTGKKRAWNRVLGCWSGQIGTNRLFWVVGRDVGFRSLNRDCPDEIGTVGKYALTTYWRKDDREEVGQISRPRLRPFES